MPIAQRCDGPTGIIGTIRNMTMCSGAARVQAAATSGVNHPKLWLRTRMLTGVNALDLIAVTPGGATAVRGSSKLLRAGAGPRGGQDTFSETASLRGLDEKDAPTDAHWQTTRVMTTLCKPGQAHGSVGSAVSTATRSSTTRVAAGSWTTRPSANC